MNINIQHLAFGLIDLDRFLTLGVVTLGLLPPIAPGRIDPVSLYLASILETQP